MSFNKAPSTYQAGRPLRDLWFPFKQRVTTHLRQRADTDADEVSVCFRKTQDAYRSFESVLATLHPHTTELLNHDRVALGWSELAGSLLSLKRVLDEGASLGLISTDFTKQFGELFEAHEVERAAQLVDVHNYPDLPRSQPLLITGFKNLLAFLDELSETEMQKKLLWLLRGGACCLIGGAQVAMGAALVSAPTTWQERLAPTQDASARPTWSGPAGWKQKPESLARCVKMHAELVFERYEAGRTKRGAPRAAEPVAKRPKVRASFDSDHEEAAPVQGPTAGEDVFQQSRDVLNEALEAFERATRRNKTKAYAASMAAWERFDAAFEKLDAESQGHHAAARKSFKKLLKQHHASL